MFEHLPQVWQDAIAQYLIYIRNISGSEASFHSYRGQLANFFAHRPGDPGSVTRTDVLSFIQSPTNGLRSRGKEASASTMNFRQCVLTSFYSFCSS